MFRQPLRIALLVACAFAGSVSSAQVIGYGTGAGAEGYTEFTDTASTTYVFTARAFESGQTLSTWSFRSGAFEGTRTVTPLLWEYSGKGNEFNLRAIGTAVVAVGATVYSDLPFGLVDGSTSITSGQFYFGWKDGTTTTFNQGVIAWNTLSEETQTAKAWGVEPFDNRTDNVTADDLGATFNFGNTSLGERTYRFAATAAIPEPGTASLALGLITAGVASRRRRARG